MSIYGPPKPQSGRQSGRAANPADARADALKRALWLTGFLTLIGFTFVAYNNYIAQSSTTRELAEAEAARREALRSLETASQEAAERLPLAASEDARRKARRAVEAAGLESAERLDPPSLEPPLPPEAAALLRPPPAPPAKLQSAELIP